MKLSDIDSQDLKKDQPKELEGDINHNIIEILEEEGITVDMLVDTALELYAPHPGLETREIAEERFRRELDIAISDANLCLLIYSGILLEREGEKGKLPNISRSSYEKDLTFIIADEVMGMSIAKYISGDKGIFEFVRFDKQKPGILSKLGPFMDDVIGGLIGGVSANMYTRGMAEAAENERKPKKNLDNSGVIAG
ncbi:MULTISPECIES: alpha-ribazole phosphatase CobZ [Methanococcoides]|jgi:alpha-ribazole phosphatase CobZ|uniref:Alpha-ribazole phosphatase CobZ n=1 Tax=Methanococcoides seepicolus TaxID=2828780 RepID=A0A9E4ZBJ9_9EURY|nr:MULTISPECIES: alpha-ribazole phosphatase CobZ [Methanococcoides]MCM1985443.1 alpha-ribazole phosphatase CobZ [Methanococcoides seepicolus]NOQ48248.1 alpha-ribazole phosphatase CobZ [Methanococcoides sp.]